MFALIINCTIIMRTKSQFSRNVYAIPRIWCNKHLRHTTTENMITIGKVDTSDLMMIITWVINISFQSPDLKWVSWTHTTPYIWMIKVIERTSSMLDTPPQDKLYRRLQVFNACEHSCIMMIMGGSKMSNTEYDLKAICILPMTYPKNCAIYKGGDYNIHVF